MNTINTILLLVIIRHLLFYNRYKLQLKITKHYISLWKLKWNYKESEFYRDKCLFYRTIGKRK